MAKALFGAKNCFDTSATEATARLTQVADVLADDLVLPPRPPLVKLMSQCCHVSHVLDVHWLYWYFSSPSLYMIYKRR